MAISFSLSQVVRSTKEAALVSFDVTNVNDYKKHVVEMWVPKSQISWSVDRTHFRVSYWFSGKLNVAASRMIKEATGGSCTFLDMSFGKYR